jgi:hypothetical protein
MSYIAEDFREMTPNGEHNFCCGGGGGFNGIGRYREQRNIGLKSQARPDPGHGRQMVVTPLPQLLGCHPRPGRDLSHRHPLELSETLAAENGDRARPSETRRVMLRSDF